MEHFIRNFTIGLLCDTMSIQKCSYNHLIVSIDLLRIVPDLHSLPVRWYGNSN